MVIDGGRQQQHARLANEPVAKLLNGLACSSTWQKFFSSSVCPASAREFALAAVGAAASPHCYGCRSKRTSLGISAPYHRRQHCLLVQRQPAPGGLDGGLDWALRAPWRREVTSQGRCEAWWTGSQLLALTPGQLRLPRSERGEEGTCPTHAADLPCLATLCHRGSPSPPRRLSIDAAQDRLLSN